MRDPGLVPHLTAEAYHADPALSHSGAVSLLETCPALFRWHRDRPDESTVRELEFGRAAHLLILQPELFNLRTVTVAEDSYRKKTAQEVRDAARAAGKVPLLATEVASMRLMAEAVRADPDAGELLSGGFAEQSFFWLDRRHGIMRKARPDYRKPGLLVDLKTTINAHPNAIGTSAYRDHWWSQAAWYAEGVEAVTGERQRVVFVAVEKSPPHLVACYTLQPSALHWATIFNDRAVATFKTCQATEIWPGYGGGIRMLPLPGFAEFQLQARYGEALTPATVNIEMGMTP